MSLHVETAVQLVWALANTEANLAGDDRIRPVHFFLGILKVADPQFQRQLEGVELPEEARQQIVQQGKAVRHYLEMSGEEVMRVRRGVRRELREGKSAKKEITMLHRSEEARAVFQFAATKAVEGGCAGLGVGHLAEALFETGNINLDKVKTRKARPGSKGARWEMVDDEKAAGHQRFAEWFGRNLSRLAAGGHLVPFVGRETQIRVMMRVLARTNKRHVVVTGGPGVGKTALVEGLALALCSKKVPETLKGYQILELHGSDVAADCNSEGQLSRRIARLFGLFAKMPSCVLFIDDFEGLFPAHLKPEGAYALLTSLLSMDGTPLVVTMSNEQWSKLRKAAPSLARRLHVVELSEPSKMDCREIAAAWAGYIGKTQGVRFSVKALQTVLEVVDGMPDERAWPDKIVDLLENTATYVKVAALSSKGGQCEVDEADVRAVLVEHYGIGDTKPQPCAS